MVSFFYLFFLIHAHLNHGVRLLPFEVRIAARKGTDRSPSPLSSFFCSDHATQPTVRRVGSMVALVPLVLSCLLWGVLVPVWPRIRLEAGNAWSAVSVVTVENTHQDKCFLTR